MNDITLECLQEFFYEGKEKYQWSYWTFLNHYKYLNKFLRWCVNQKYIKENPIPQIHKPKKPQNLPRRLTQEEGQKILCSTFNYHWPYDFQQTRNYAITATFLFSGIRASELINLSVTDIDLDNSQIFIRSGKGNKDRYVPMHYKLKNALRRYESDKRRLGKNSIYYFTSVRSNKPITYKVVSKICKTVSQFSNVRFTPHQLRHTFASVSIEQGMGLVQAKEILGHSNIQSTMIYLKMTPQGLKDSLNKIELF